MCNDSLHLLRVWICGTCTILSHYYYYHLGMIFGSFIGGMADWGGRRRFVILFSIIYAASCMTKHFKDFNVLMLGRLLGGVATSLLFSVFDAWLIRSHSDAKLGKQFLGQSFSAAAYGNSIIAIGAGLVANKAAASTTMEIFPQEPIYFGGYLNPFDIALGALILCGILATILWDENYGEEEKHETGEVGVDKNSDDGRSAPNWYDGLKNAFVVTMRSQDILLCGIISSLFEGSMYIFVFMWTPALSALTAGEAKLPFGLIFSTFMVSCMCGSSLFSVLIGKFKGEQLGVGVFAVASTSMAMIAMGGTDTISFVAMLLFEMCVGMYWPIMGTMKGYIVPEDKRAAIYNLYRIPLNFIVLFSLLTDLTPTQSFTLNGAMLATATILQAILMKRRLLMQGIGDKSLTSDEEIAPLKLDEGKSENV
jgi:MFS transporter, MFS domain-containing protein family, molybdate-anion transporter